MNKKERKLRAALRNSQRASQNHSEMLKSVEEVAGDEIYRTISSATYLTTKEEEDIAASIRYVKNGITLLFLGRWTVKGYGDSIDFLGYRYGDTRGELEIKVYSPLYIRWHNRLASDTSWDCIGFKNKFSCD